jgi:hypothetical protein
MYIFKKFTGEKLPDPLLKLSRFTAEKERGGEGTTGI